MLFEASEALVGFLWVTGFLTIPTLLIIVVANAECFSCQR